MFAESRAGHRPPRHPHTDSDTPRARPHQPSEGTQDSSPCPQICGCRRRVEPDAWRHACPVRRRLLRVKPRRFNHENNPQLLSDEQVASGAGATWTNSRVFLRAVMLESVRRRLGHRATTPRNPSRGVRGPVVETWTSLNPCRRGELVRSDAGDRVMTTPGDRSKRPAVKSSTMRGPRGLGGESRRRRCRTA